MVDDWYSIRWYNRWINHQPTSNSPGEMINPPRRYRWSIRSKIVNRWQISKFDEMVKICQILKFSSIGIVGFTIKIVSKNWVSNR